MNKVIHGDCLERMKDLEANSIDLIFTDPPYGKEGALLYQSLYTEAERVLKQGGMCIVYASDYWLDLIFPAKSLDYFYLFHKLNNRGTASVFPRKIFAGGKSILLFSKGKPKTINWCSNILKFTTKEKSHRKDNWEQTIEDAALFIEKYSKEGDVILDPFAGSGTTAIACLNLNRNYILIEKEKKYIGIINKRIAEHEQQLSMV